ncbi:MAG: beta-lactamase family protein [Acidobacteria bacterium]|nr:beta-lactamase family protein [Acidobacteriota bacterium]
MAVSRLRRWGRWFLYIAQFFACVLMAVWPASIYLSERAAQFSGDPAPTRVGIANPRYGKAVRQASAHVQAMIAERQIPGLSVAVAVDGEIIWSEAFGYTDAERRVQATPETQFRVASVSKTFTAAAMARLFEKGRFDLDAPIQTYVPDFPDKGYRITARQLASHRAGIRAYFNDNEALNTKNYHNVRESLEKFRDDPLAFPPDTEFLYSGYGYVLLSAMIQEAAGEDFLKHMQRSVFDPLGMTHTVADRVDDRAPNQSKFYDNVSPYSMDGAMVESPRIDFSCKWAAGGFLSTAEDMVRFGSAHIAPMNRGFLEAKTLRMLFTPRTRQAGIMGHGLGWISARDLHLRQAHFNFGAGSGGSSVLAIYPEQRVCIAIACNLGHARFGTARLFGIANSFLSEWALYVIGAFWVCTVAGCAIVVWRWLRRRRAHFR